MLLGKRHRLPSTIRRTTSMSGITVYNDPLSPVDASSESDPPADQILGDLHATVGPEHASFVNHVSDSNNNSSNYNVDSFGNKNNFDHLYDNRFLTSMVSPRYGSSRIGGGSGGFVETAHFLRTCGLCKRRLAPGKDIYMYRGETAFCSRECREQQIQQDEVKEKCRVMELSTREDRDTSPPPPPPPPSSSSSPSSTRSSKASPLSERRLWLLLDPHDELID